MDVSSTQTTIGSAQTAIVAETHLYGKPLVLARSIWIVLVVFALGLLAFSMSRLPHLLAQFQVTCRDGQCTTGFLSSDALRTLHTAGVTVNAFAIFYIIIYALIPLLVWVSAGLFIAWRKSDDWMALLVSLFLILFQVSVSLGGLLENSPGSENTTTQTAPMWFVLFYFFSQSIAFPVLALFPNGRFVPRWMIWPTITFVVAEFLNGFVPSSSLLGLIGFLLLLASFTCLAGTMIYRYRRGATLLERQQIKWLAFGIFLDLILNWIGPPLLSWLFPQAFAPSSLPNVLYQLVWPLTVLILPISIGIAILRYHLWNIDIIINRTLVYGVLSACVVGTYVLVVGYLGALFHTNGNLLIELIAALREQVAHYQLNQVQVEIEAPESFPKLSAAVEVAAYRIALEALANVLKHAQATICTMRLDLLDDTLIIEVVDNGVGPGPTGYRTGIGMTAMRERAVELGGSCIIGAGSTGGTRVYARFPVRKE